MLPLGFSVGMPGESASKIVSLHLRASTLAAGQVDEDLAALVIDVSDIAIRSIENELFLLELITLLADDGRQSLTLAGEVFFLLLDLGGQIGDFGGLLVVGGLKLADLRDQDAALVFVSLLFGQDVGLRSFRRPWFERRPASWRRSSPTRGSSAG